MPYVDLPGVHLWYNDTGGTGTPVVFMHAASGTCESWVYQLPVFTAAGYRCITYDRRNRGRSRPDAGARNWPCGRQGTGLKPAPTQSRQQPGSVSDAAWCSTWALLTSTWWPRQPAGSAGWTTRWSTRSGSAASWSPTASAACRTQNGSAAPAPAAGNSAAANRVARTRASPGHQPRGHAPLD